MRPRAGGRRKPAASASRRLGSRAECRIPLPNRRSWEATAQIEEAKSLILLVPPPRLERGTPRSTICPNILKRLTLSANSGIWWGLRDNGLGVVLQTKTPPPRPAPSPAGPSKTSLKTHRLEPLTQTAGGAPADPGGRTPSPATPTSPPDPQASASRLDLH